MSKAHAYMNTWQVEYNRDKAEVDIEDLIDELMELKDQGVEKIVGLTGNYRGARYIKLGMPYQDEEDEDKL